MATKNIEYVIAISSGAYGNSWGGGKTIEEAKRNLRKEDRTGKLRALLFFDCPREKITIQTAVDLHYSFPIDATCMRIEVK